MVGERFTCGGLEKDSHVHDSNTIIIKHHVLFVLFCIFSAKTGAQYLHAAHKIYAEVSSIRHSSAAP